MKYIQGNNNFVRQYKLKRFEFPPGDELIKLYMYNYLTDKKNKLSEDDRIKLAIKYQIFIEETSLFAEAELSEKISTPMISNYNQYNSINIIYDEISHEKVDLNIPILHKDENPSLSKNKLNEEDNKLKKNMQEIEEINNNQNDQINMDQMPPNDFKDPELYKLFEELNKSDSKLDNGNVKKSENIDERKKIVNYNGLGWNELDVLTANIIEEDFFG